MLSRRLLESQYTRHWSAKFMKFLRMVSLYSTPAGTIVITQKQLAEKVGVQLQTIKKYFRQAEEEDLLSKNITDKNKHTYIFKYPVHFANFTFGYTKHYKFLETKAFESLPLFAQRFILHALANGVGNGNQITVSFSDLYVSTKKPTGLFYARSIRNAICDIEHAKQFLMMNINKNSRRIEVFGLQDSIDRSVFINESQKIEVMNIAYAYYHELNMTEQVIDQILRVRKKYYNAYGLHAGEKLFQKAIKRLLNCPSFYSAVKESTVTQLFITIYEHIIDENPELIKEAIDHEKQRLLKLEENINEFRKKALYRVFRKTTEQIKDTVKTLIHAFRSRNPKNWWQKDLDILHAMFSQYAPKRHVVDFSPYNWLENS